MSDDITPDEARRMAQAQTELGSPGQFVYGFLNFLAADNAHDARACLDPEYSSSDPALLGHPDSNGVEFVLGDHWGLYSNPEVLDNGDEVVTFVELDEPGKMKYVPAGPQRVRAVKFTVRRNDDFWSIVRIVRHGC